MQDSRLHILIVEDSADDARSLMSILEAIPDYTFRIDWARSIAEAKAVLHSKDDRVDLIFCDFILENETGLDFLKMLQSCPAAPPVIMITAMDDHNVDVACMEAGARDYLRKGSLSPEALERVIRYTTHNHRTETELKAALKVREQMLSIVSHDIAGPLATLHATLRLLVARVAAGDTEKCRLFLEKAETSAAGILELTKKLLEWAKAQTHHFVCHPEPVALAEVVEQEQAALEVPASAKDLTLHVDLSPGHVAYVDRDSIAAVVRNLLTNAVKFSRKGETIEISGAHRGGRVELTVRDHGVGIPPDLRGDLFNEEKKTAQPGTMNEKGHGIGLMLCKALLERNAGQISVQSEPDAGATFTVSLPTPENPPPAPPPSTPGRVRVRKEG
ncbi:MAG: hybrid sensor histidine kinase/response regulator [Opitutales bacterium]|nr:hybrid sensor histidine kinase/response regulator [Opitutales bacterium]